MIFCEGTGEDAAVTKTWVPGEEGLKLFHRAAGSVN